MANIQRKPKPSAPLWYWLDADNCWWCSGKNRHGCSSCKFLKEFKRDYKDKKEKEKEKYEYEYFRERT